MSLAGRRAIVTGGGRGIGAAVARGLAQAGATVLVAARSRLEVEAVATALTQEGHTVYATRCDVTEPDSVRGLARTAQERLGAVDILVNNAGTASAAPVHKITLEEWNRLFAVNATGTLLCTQVFLPDMIERKWGRVVNIASIAGLSGDKYIAAYSAAKHAVVGFTRSAAAETAGTGVTVNAICPGYVDTPMTDETLRKVSERTGKDREDALRAVLAHAQQPRLVTPEEVATAVVALCGDHAADVTGQAIVLDAGAGRA